MDNSKQWYIIHTYSGYERKVAESLMNRIQAYELGECIGQILIPTEDVVETKSGKKIVTTKLTFPGYILVEMDMTDKAWHIVRGTPKVTGFISTGKKTDAPDGRGNQRGRQSGFGYGGTAEAEIYLRSRRFSQDYRRAVQRLYGSGRRCESR